MSKNTFTIKEKTKTTGTIEIQINGATIKSNYTEDNGIIHIDTYENNTSYTLFDTDFYYPDDPKETSVAYSLGTSVEGWLEENE